MRIIRASLCPILAAACFAGLARGIVFRQYFVVYPPSEESAAVVHRLSAHSVGGADGFAGKAELSLKTERVFEPSSTVAIALAPPTASEGSGWMKSSRMNAWNPRVSTDSLRIAFAPISAGSGPVISPQGRNELWIDYANSAEKNPSNIGLSLELSGRRFEYGQWRSLRLKAYGSQVLAERVLEVVGARWLRKDVLYTLRKWLRLPSDGVWRYTHWSHYTVLQRRFHEPLRDVGEIALVLRSGAPMGINLRVSAHDNSEAGELIEVPTTYPELDEMGRWVLHINARAIAHQHITDTDAVYLQELTIFVAAANDDVSDRLRQVIFRISPVRKGEILLPARVITVGSHGRRLIADLSPVQYEGADMILRSGSLDIVPMIPQRPGGVRVESVRLVTISEQQTPAALHLGRSMTRRWGGAFFDSLGSDRVEWPRIDGYFPFSALSPKRIESKEKPAHDARFMVKSPSRSPERAPRARIPHDESFVVRAVGRELSISGLLKPRKAASDKTGFVLQGAGNWIDVDWPVAADVDSDSRLYVGMDEGAGFVRRIALTLDLEGGRRVALEAAPNLPVELGVGKGRVRHVSAHLEMLPLPFQMHFTEIVLFRPRSVPLSDAFDERFLAPQDAKLMPSAIVPLRGVSISTAGYLSGIISAEGARWTTALDRPVDWVKDIQISYRVPAELAASNPCWLGLTLETTGGPVARSICTWNSSATVFVPWGALVGAANDARPAGALRSIRWEILPGKAGSSAFTDPRFGFEATIEGIGLESLREDFRAWPAVTVGTRTAISIPPSRGLFEELSKGRASFGLDSDSMMRLMADADHVGSAENPYFALDAVVLKPRALLPQDAWAAPPVVDPSSGALGRRLKRIAVFVLAAGFVSFWRRRAMEARRWIASIAAAARARAGTASDAVLNRFESGHRPAVIFIFWTLLASFFYLLAFWAYGGDAEIYCVSLGALSLVPALFAMLPDTGSAFSRALTGALLMIVAVAILTMFRLERAAEQAGIVAFYCLLIAAFVGRIDVDAEGARE